jgi:hypothetical protein
MKEQNLEWEIQSASFSRRTLDKNRICVEEDVSDPFLLGFVFGRISLDSVSIYCDF